MRCNFCSVRTVRSKKIEAVCKTGRQLTSDLNRFIAGQRAGEAEGSRVERVESRSVLLPENLHTYFELSAQAWNLYKAP